MNKFELSLFCILFSILFSSTVVAETTFSESEAGQLPPFCLGLSVGYFQDSAKHLKRDIKIPPTFESPHHFCSGMAEIIRGDQGDKKSYNYAIQEFDYVLGRSTSLSQNELMDSAHLYKAEALGKLGQSAPALQEYNKAIQLNPKYHQAYARLADFYLKLGMKQDALDTVNVGLKFSPNSKGLRNRLRKLTAEK
jgi:tetratricopeptide (TPR) repeat protein